MNNFSPLFDADRLEALLSSGLLDTPAEYAFDNITSNICKKLNVPIAVISLIEPGRQFFKSQKGLDENIRQTHIRYSICRYVVEIGSTIVVNNASIAFGLSDHPAVIEDNVMAYLGAPFFFKGQIIGSVCAADKKARKWSQRDIKFIEKMALEAKFALVRRNNNIADLQHACGDMQGV